MERMTSLNICDNRLTSKSLVTLLHNLTQRPLVALDISFNSLGGPAVPSLVTFVKANGNLSNLNVRHGQLKEQVSHLSSQYVVDASLLTGFASCEGAWSHHRGIRQP
jgi:hypothetical protein